MGKNGAGPTRIRKVRLIHYGGGSRQLTREKRFPLIRSWCKEQTARGFPSANI